MFPSESRKEKIRGEYYTSSTLLNAFNNQVFTTHVCLKTNYGDSCHRKMRTSIGYAFLYYIQNGS